MKKDNKGTEETKKCKFCYSDININATICPNCKMQVKVSKYRLIIGLPLLLIVVALGVILTLKLIKELEEDYVDYSEYNLLDPQSLQNDYVINEITAKDKYSNNYYYFSGEIYEITDFLTDNYVTIRSTNNQKEPKYIELNGYFKKGSEEIKSLKKGDNVTLYCKYNKRTYKDFLDTSTYSFDSCRLK